VIPFLYSNKEKNMPIVTIINILVVVVGVLNALLGQPFLTPDLVAIVTAAVVVLNAIIDLLRYFAPEGSRVKSFAQSMRV
jgi:hypothetical protein